MISIRDLPLNNLRRAKHLVQHQPHSIPSSWINTDPREELDPIIS